MKRNIGIWMVAGLLILHFIAPVYADQKDDSAIEAVSGYCLGDEIHAFIQLNDGYDAGSFKVSLQSDDVDSNDAAALIPITESSSIVRYVFMVDLSSSMRWYTDEVNAFVEAITTQEKQEAIYTVATFGEQFEVVDENLTDKNAVTKVLNNLRYTEQLTDPYTGVESALTYLDSYSRRNGDVINLIIITDGDPDLGKDAEKENEFAQSVADKIKNTPEIIVSTFCTAEWDLVAYDTFSTGKGIHVLVNDNQDAKAAGEKMADYVDGLYLTSFKLSKKPVSERFNIVLQMRGSNSNGQKAFLDVGLENVPNLKMFSNISSTDSVQEETTNTETVIEGMKESENADTVAETEYTEKVSEDDTEVTGQNKTDKNNIFLIIPIAAVIIAAGISVMALIKKRNQGKAASVSDRIAMKLEVYAGNCVSKKSVFYLRDSFIIGSAKTCDLVFSNQDVAPQNSRIFIKNQMIYIEDLNSNEGTALGGMRIQGENRLRSGDVISIGTVEFSLKF